MLLLSDGYHDHHTIFTGETIEYILNNFFGIPAEEEKKYILDNINNYITRTLIGEELFLRELEEEYKIEESTLIYSRSKVDNSIFQSASLTDSLNLNNQYLQILIEYLTKSEESFKSEILLKKLC